MGCGAGSEPLCGGTAAGGGSGGNLQLGDVVINEACPNAECQVPDEDDVGGGVQERVDWIELYNRSTAPIDLEGYLLTDELTLAGAPQYMVRLPRGLAIQPGGYLVLYADLDLEAGPRHLPFRLSTSDTLTLAAPTAGTEPWQPDSGVDFDAAEVLDQVRFSLGAGSTTRSYARVPNATGPHAWCTPTANASNDTASCQ
jgi:hypothetical protein